jgi:hypothetical protein
MFKKILIPLALGSASALAAVPAFAADAPAVVDAARLKLAEEVVVKLVPPGTYQRMMNDFAKGDLMQQILGMDMGALAGMAGEKVDEAGAHSGKTLMELASEKDPHFKERMDISMKVMFEEMGTMFAKIEPDVRAALSQIYARKYDAKQLADMNGFFATPSGSAFARDFMSSFMDKEMIGASMKAVPAMLEGMPVIMKKVEAATAHLPPMPGAGNNVADAAADAAAAAGDAAMAAASGDNGTEPWYDRENWSAADRNKIGALEAASHKAMGASLDYEGAAIDRTRQRYLKQGWKAPKTSE